MGERIVLLGRKGSATAILYHELVRDFDVQVVFEQPPSTAQLLRSRARRLGWWEVFGQLLFQILVAKPMTWMSGARRREILAQHNASDTAIPHGVTSKVPSVNTPACWDLVRSLAPQVIVINGTRILSKKAIAALGVPVLNTHVGITPMYRGVHGAYWALAQGDHEHCGVTVHLVDEGIDTGGILYQALIEPTEKDNFTTYPSLQMVAGSKLMVKAVREIIDERAVLKPATGSSRRWNHPTLWAYLANRFRRGVR